LCWEVFRIAFGLLSTSVKFAEVGPWVWKFPASVRQTVAAGVAALFWTLWKARNAVVFFIKFYLLTLAVLGAFRTGLTIGHDCRNQTGGIIKLSHAAAV
jgi:hypothetical protein